MVVILTIHRGDSFYCWLHNSRTQVHSEIITSRFLDSCMNKITTSTQTEKTWRDSLRSLRSNRWFSWVPTSCILWEKYSSSWLIWNQWQECTVITVCTCREDTKASERTHRFRVCDISSSNSFRCLFLYTSRNISDYSLYALI